ncbi:MAG: RagB/SusD family nutrient uptake outer membrane protein [Bacteroidales bacterium]|nr:RagB/SusD family nutrient uptake outer membrane protein [Bacteroidales bacterium]
MKSINKLIASAAVVLGLGAMSTSCVNDLDLTPEDPRSFTWADIANDPDTYLPQALNKCYSVLAVSGQSGEGSADLSGMDAGKSCYQRALFMLNEKSTDECAWIYTEDGVDNIVKGSWTNGHGLIYGTYSRLYVIIAICNDFIRQVEASGIELNNKTSMNCAAQYIREARAIRALAYYNVLDMWGNAGWVDETVPYGTNPTPIVRKDLYAKLVAELKDIIATWPADAKLVYGRVGLDGVKTLLAKVYLNAEIYVGENHYAECLDLCNQIIANHQGGGFKNSGLANHYLAVFSANNDRYMPGGSKPDENEILWGVPYENTYIQAYGGTRYLMAASMSNGSANTYEEVDIAKSKYKMACADYGINDQWGCMHAREQFSDKFIDSNDCRDDLWCKEAEGFTKENTDYSKFNNGYAAIKFTNLLTKEDGTFYLNDETAPVTINNISAASKALSANVHPDTDLPLFRLADIYLMKAECYVLGGQGSAADALDAVNIVRERAGAAAWSNLTSDALLDERARELYWENHRRSDLIRFHKFTSGYNWAWKGGVYEGTDINDYQTVFPIPANLIAAQPEFASIQNPGY